MLLCKRAGFYFLLVCVLMFFSVGGWLKSVDRLKIKCYRSNIASEVVGCY